MTLQRLRMRQAGGRQFADVVIAVPPGAAVGQGHAAADRVEEALDAALPGSDVVVHVEPQEDEAAIRERAHAPRSACPRVREVHNVTVLDVGGRTEVSLHLKLPGELSLEEAHEVANQVESAIAAAVPEVDSVQTHLEPLTDVAGGRRRWRTTAPSGTSCSSIVREITGQEPRELRFVRHRRRAARLPDARPRSVEPARRSARARERDRGAHPPRTTRHRRRGRPHRAMTVAAATLWSYRCQARRRNCDARRAELLGVRGSAAEQRASARRPCSRRGARHGNENVTEVS